MTAILLGRLILFGISIISVIGAQSASEQCYPCNEVKRVWSSVFCEKDFNDCGDCYHGYQENEARECVLQTDKEIRPNGPVRIPSGSSIILRCQGQDITNCEWERKGQPVEIKERYQLIGTNIKNCSLRIADFQKIDASDWICRSDGKYPNEHRWSLYLAEHNLLYVNEGETKLVPFGQSVVLNCYLGVKGNCSWDRRGSPVEIIRPRYECVYQNRTDHGDTEWSLRINDFQKMDVGEWYCQNSHGAIELKIPVKPANQTTNIEPNQTVTIGKSVTLNCGYDVRVNCGWERNGQIIPIEGAYRYIVGEKGRNTKNCSLEIPFLDSEDLGIWRCGYKYDQMVNYKMASSTSLFMAQEKNITEDVTSTPGNVTEGLGATNCTNSSNTSTSSILWWTITSTLLNGLLACVVTYYLLLKSPTDKKALNGKNESQVDEMEMKEDKKRF